jgi:hypothetical protein
MDDFQVKIDIASLTKELSCFRELEADRWAAHQRVHDIEAFTREDTKKEMNRRLEGMNEFRAEMSATDAKYMARSEYQVAYQAIGERVDVLARLVYVGLGIVLLASAVIGWELSIRR